MLWIVNINPPNPNSQERDGSGSFIADIRCVLGVGAMLSARQGEIFSEALLNKIERPKWTGLPEYNGFGTEVRQTSTWIEERTNFGIFAD
jgi:hypothetical protein